MRAPVAARSVATFADGDFDEAKRKVVELRANPAPSATCSASRAAGCSTN